MPDFETLSEATATPHEACSTIEMRQLLSQTLEGHQTSAGMLCSNLMTQQWLQQPQEPCISAQGRRSNLQIKVCQLFPGVLVHLICIQIFLQQADGTCCVPLGSLHGNLQKTSIQALNSCVPTPSVCMFFIVQMLAAAIGCSSSLWQLLESIFTGCRCLGHTSR